MKLVVVESPAKCSKIKSFLGTDYNVIASMGHIRALQQHLDAVGIDRDFTPTYTFMEEKAKAIAALKAAAKGCDQVILAADDDREGEAIAYSVCELLRLKPADTSRAVFHEITEKAVKAAVANPRRLDMNRVNAQQARAMLDMMIGFTISPLLWKHVAPGLSAGRCQTPALRFIVEKEQECEAHTVSSSWKVTGKWTAAAGAQPFPAVLDDTLIDEDSARAYLEMRRDTEWAVVRKATTKPWTASAPAPLITSTLQQEASALFHTPPKSTMKAAQRLYEAGHITYMRTDSAVLSEEAVQAAKELITARFGAEYVGAAPTATATPPQPKKSTKKAAVAAAAAATQLETPKAQEAHEAIRPTHFDLETLSADEDWTHQERQIYKLIWQRAVQSVMAAARGETRTVEFYPDDEEEFNWTATWRRTTFAGWKALGVKQANLDEDSDTEAEAQAQAQSPAAAWAAASALTVGMQLKWAEIHATPHETKAPPRYTEATLVRDLEKRGIGRPSTFASLIASIMDKEYVETKDIPGKEITQKTLTLTPTQWPPKETIQKRTMGAEKRKVVPTSLGKSVYAFALKHFNDLFDYSFTASMENRLDHIAAGEEQWKGVLQDTWASYKDRYTTLNATSTTTQKGKVDPARQRDLGEGLKVIQSRKGPLLLIEPTEEGAKAKFFSLPPKATYESLTAEVAHAWVKAQKGETVTTGGSGSGGGAGADASQIVRKKGPYGWYAQCGDIRASCGEHDTCEELEEKIAAKRAGTAATSPAVKVGTYEFKTGAYGPYMYKTDIKTRKFVSIPAGTDTTNLTQKDADALYKAGLEKKSKAAPSNWKRADKS